jgi:phospholipase C
MTWRGPRRVVVAMALAGLCAAPAGCRAECRSKNAGLVPQSPEDAVLRCPLALPADSHAAARSACTFGPGATAEETLGLGAPLAAELPIRHVIVVMRENRSFDHLLGGLRSLQPEADLAPDTFVNRDSAGRAVRPFRASSTCRPLNPEHQWDAMHYGVNDGAMDNFVKSAQSLVSDGHEAMSFFDEEQLPFQTWLASTYALSDRHFASVRSGTVPNRLFMLLGTNDGVRETGAGYPKSATPTLFGALERAGLTWAAYSDGDLVGGALDWDADSPGCACLDDFFARADTGTLPNVVFVDGIPDFDDDHPPADLQRGEAWTRAIYEHVVKSPQWPRIAMVWTYDEGGGFADHVPPPDACVARPGTVDDAYFALGPRVPFVVVSPWAKPHFVSHAVQEHTAVTRFIEAVFGLPALSARDANSSALLDFFDFSSCTPPLLVPPEAPAAGTGGCPQ